MWKILTIENRAFSSSYSMAPCLEKLSFLNKPVEIVQVRSFGAAKTLLTNSQDEDIAVILMDIMSDNQESGLAFIRYVRNTLKNDIVRIILRTGYPYVTPDRQAIKDYQIDGYVSQEDIAYTSLEISVMTAIRTYNQILINANIMRALASSIAHEIRNPFNAVAGYNAAIEHHLPKSEKTIDATTKTYQISSDNLRHIQNSLTKSNKAIQLGGKITDAILLSLKNETLDPNNFSTYKASEIINYALEHYGYSEDTERDLITTHIQADFPLLADHDLLIYVHFNLIKNALYYKNTTNFHITITATSGTTTNQIKIKDYGPGITPDKIHQIFNDFYSAGKKGGTGLGLPFCKRTMQAFKGDIDCNSQQNAWTEFTLTFPKINSPVLNPIKNTIKQQPPKTQLPELGVMQKTLADKHLLIIDDEESNRYAIIMLLQDSQCHFHQAKNGKAALQKIKQCPYDAIFSDLNMPEMNGDQMISQIKHNPEYKKNRDTPILMITGKTGTKDREIMLAAGATDILSKPLNKATLLASLYKHMPKPVEADLNQSQKKVLSAEQTEQSKIKLLSKKSGIDLVYAAEQYDRTLVQIKRELETLVARSEGLISTIQHAYDQQDYETIETRLHKIVYLPQLYNLEPLTRLLRKLETQAADQEFEDFGADLLRLEALLGDAVGCAKIVMENVH